MQITENFNLEEFTCKCGCGYDKISINLVHRLQVLRDIHDSPITILSGCRCPAHNLIVKGSPKSKHLTGLAVDFTTEDIEWLAMFIEDWSGGFHFYKEKNFIHLDVSERRRWSDT